MTEQESEAYLTPVEVADMLGVSRQTVDRWGREGRIKRYRRGIMRGVFYKRSEIEPLTRIMPDEYRRED